MALVPITDLNKTSATYNLAEKKSIRYKLPADSEKVALDYDALRQLCEMKKNRSTEEAHQAVMANYHKIFAKKQRATAPPKGDQGEDNQLMPSSLITAVPTRSTMQNKSVTLSKEQAGVKKKVDPAEPSHDIRIYMSRLHRERKFIDPEELRMSNLATLRKLLRKLPFERSTEENDQIASILLQFPTIMEHISKRLLKDLVAVAQLDTWKDADITVFGNTGLHMVLRGSVRALTYPYVHVVGEPFDERPPTPTLDADIAPILNPGDCFGSLQKVGEDRAINTRILSVMTAESNCDFLRISTSDYARIVDSLNHREQAEKVGLLQSCRTFHEWSKQPITEIASLFEWAKFPANTVLVTEGLRAPFMAVIKSGTCHVLRRVDVKETLPNKKQRHRQKEVIVGKLGPSDAFGELSCATHEPMVCSIVTASAVELACVEPQQLSELNEITLQLLTQSCSQTFGHLSKADVHEEYINQELKCEWNEFKHSAVMDVINSRGIRPGIGKWTR